jgi:hypothetical protein
MAPEQGCSDQANGGDASPLEGNALMSSIAFSLDPGSGVPTYL